MRDRGAVIVGALPVLIVLCDGATLTDVRSVLQGILGHEALPG